MMRAYEALRPPPSPVVTPRLREQVFARDSMRCTVPGCRAARNLEAHRIIEQARGGPHTLSNLTLLCSGHRAIKVVPSSPAGGVPAGTSSERRPPSAADRARTRRVRSDYPDAVAGGQLDDDALA
jgi:hypothetical protein